jgi:hypothetical protein
MVAEAVAVLTAHFATAQTDLFTLADMVALVVALVALVVMADSNTITQAMLAAQQMVVQQVAGEAVRVGTQRTLEVVEVMVLVVQAKAV